MKQLQFEELLDAGCHFGHLKRKWSPNMAPYIYMERNSIHVIDLYKTIAKAEEAAKAIKQIAKSNKKILFIGTKKQAKELIAEAGKKTNMPYVTERWPGGLLTNFATIRKAVKKIASIDKLTNDEQFKNISKRERLQIIREKAKLEKNFGSIKDLTRIPSALFIVDVNKEHIAVAEARKLNIPTFAIVDTNADPRKVNFPIPANDDAAKSISLILNLISDAINEGINERISEKEEYEEQLQEQEEKNKAELSSLKEFEDDEEPEKVKKTKKDRIIKLQMDDDEVKKPQKRSRIIPKKK